MLASAMSAAVHVNECQLASLQQRSGLCRLSTARAAAGSRGGCLAAISSTLALASLRGILSKKAVRRFAKIKETSASCDYLVVGAGASGMAFVDTLLQHSGRSNLSVMIVDKRLKPGGHWNDAYGFVKLHQAATNYGVETLRLEDFTTDPHLQASRCEILEYYSHVMDRFVNKHKVQFFPSVDFDFATTSFTDAVNEEIWSVNAGTVVDARFTEPDIPTTVRPAFEYNSDCVRVITPRDLADTRTTDRFCVVGGGKTGQDTIIHLQDRLAVPPQNIAWVMPNDPWITLRTPPMDTCMEFIDTCLKAEASSAHEHVGRSVEYMQQGFLKLERQGKVFRIDPSVEPTKFVNATLDGREVEVLRRVAANIIRKGRISRITDSGSLCFADGSIQPLPWSDEGISCTTFVHCSAGAFNFSSSAFESRPAVFQPGKITLQEIFSYPGFCFNGSLIAKLECEGGLDMASKNAMCELPPLNVPADVQNGALGPAGGGITPLHSGHGLVVALRNLRRWYGHPGLGEWLHGMRLFSLTMNGYNLAEGRDLANSNWEGLMNAGIVE